MSRIIVSTIETILIRVKHLETHKIKQELSRIRVSAMQTRSISIKHNEIYLLLNMSKESSLEINPP